MRLQGIKNYLFVSIPQGCAIFNTTGPTRRPPREILYHKSQAMAASVGLSPREAQRVDGGGRGLLMATLKDNLAVILGHSQVVGIFTSELPQKQAPQMSSKSFMMTPAFLGVMMMGVFFYMKTQRGGGGGAMGGGMGGMGPDGFGMGGGMGGMNNMGGGMGMGGNMGGNMGSMGGAMGGAMGGGMAMGNNQMMGSQGQFGQSGGGGNVLLVSNLDEDSVNGALLDVGLFAFMLLSASPCSYRTESSKSGTRFATGLCIDY